MTLSKTGSFASVTGWTAGARATRSCSTCPTRPNARPGSCGRRRAPARARPSAAPRATGGTAGRSAARCADCPSALLRSATCRNRCRSSSKLSRCQMFSHRYEIGSRRPDGRGLPAPPEFPAPADPTLNGRNRYRRRPAASSRTPGRGPPRNARGSAWRRTAPSGRVRRYCAFACLDVLAGQRVLQLGGRDRDAVDEERQVHESSRPSPRSAAAARR